MKILWVATKAPWPPVDGGRRLLLDTLRALSAAGHELTLVAPVTGGESQRLQAETALTPFCRPQLVAVRRLPRLIDVLRAQLMQVPVTVMRHTIAAVQRRVAAVAGAERSTGTGFDVVMAEQMQALSAAEKALGVPVVLRAQNVESDLWVQAAGQGGWQGKLLAREARQLAAWEGRAVGRCAATLALTRQDAERLAELAAAVGFSDARIEQVPAPFDSELPAADAPLIGEPPVVLFGSGGWLPNSGGAEWFVNEVWPRVQMVVPGAVLHVLGIADSSRRPVDAPSSEGMVWLPAPKDSRDAFAAGSVLVVPLGIASGVRIKILEAWARGVPVVATPAAARGLDAEDEEHLLLGSDAAELTRAIARLGRDPALVARLVANGRQRLRDRHALPRVAAEFERILATL